MNILYKDRKEMKTLDKLYVHTYNYNYSKPLTFILISYAHN